MRDTMALMDALDAYRRGWSLPQALYIDPDAFEADIDAVFASQWIFALNACEIARPGDWTTLEVAGNSVIVLRDLDGEVRAFHNSCRHRGSRLCLEEHGASKLLVCPYHQWTYRLDGTLRNARQMPKDFDPSGFGLKPVAVEMLCGMIYICLAARPPSFERFRANVAPYIAPHRPERTKVALAMTIVEECNWKLVIENNRECYHCAANHPELLATLVEFPRPDDPSAPPEFRDLIARKAATWDRLGLPHRPVDGGIDHRCVRLPFVEGALSFTLDGTPACGRLLGDLTEQDLGSVRMFTVPNNWNHFLSDHIIHFRVLPLGPDRTALRTTWHVHEEAIEGVDYDLDHLTAVWKATNAQDAHLGEINHLGIRSMAYEPGPYAPSEFALVNFTDWYVRTMRAHLAPPSLVSVAAE